MVEPADDRGLRVCGPEGVSSVPGHPGPLPAARQDPAPCGPLPPGRAGVASAIPLDLSRGPFAPLHQRLPVNRQLVCFLFRLQS